MHKRLVHLALAVAVLCFAFEKGYGAPPAPVAYWSFDGDGLDASGNHNDAALYGKATYTLGFYGQAAQFHGNGDYFQVANNPAIQLRSTQQFSVAAYVQLATLNQQNILIHGLGGSTWASWFLGVLGGEPDATLYPESFVFGVRSNNGSVYTGVTAKAVVGQWVHLAATYDGATLKLYVDGVLQSSAVAPLPYNSAESLYLGGNPGRGFSWYGGLLDEVYIFTEALTADEVKVVMQGPIQLQLASGPDPARGATDAPQDATLSWTAGKYAATHDVYLGKVLADVNNASRIMPEGVLASQGQAATTYPPPTVLDFGEVYYWRVDEVSEAPDSTIYKGNVWSFTVEPYSYPLTTGITATASGAQLNQGPEKTIDGSGLTGDLHGTDATTMWLNLSLPPIWIQYRFDRVYALDKLPVWNSNQTIEASGIVSLGTKDVTIEYSVDGAKWVALPGVPQFAKAPGKAGYAANTTVNFGGAMAKYVKLTINSSWMGVGVMASTGLSEVRFYYTPVQARLPQPVAGATGQGVTTMLNWHPGRDVIGQMVYFGTDPSAVAQDAVASQTVTACTYDPGILAYGTTYYWRVDEIGTAGTYPGEVWSFTTQEFTGVDDFESYNDTERILVDSIDIGGKRWKSSVETQRRVATGERRAGFPGVRP